MPEVEEEEIKRLVRSTCDAKGKNYIPIEDFERVFKEQTDSYLPFKHFGCVHRPETRVLAYSIESTSISKQNWQMGLQISPFLSFVQVFE